MYKEQPVVSFVSEAAFYDWLAVHNQSQQPFWLRYYKKNSGKATIAPTQAVNVALCWGWIDGLLNTYDDESYVVRFTPRRPKSVWSTINVEKVAVLIQEGRMQPSGMAHVLSAQADGRWDASYGGQATLTPPQVFLDLLAANTKAKAAYDALTKTQKYSYAFRLVTAVGAQKQQRLAEKIHSTISS